MYCSENGRSGCLLVLQTLGCSVYWWNIHILCIYKYFQGHTHICGYIYVSLRTGGIYIYNISINTVKETHIYVDTSVFSSHLYLYIL